MGIADQPNVCKKNPNRAIEGDQLSAANGLHVVCQSLFSRENRRIPGLQYLTPANRRSGLIQMSQFAAAFPDLPVSPKLSHAGLDSTGGNLYRSPRIAYGMALPYWLHGSERRLRENTYR